jgi:glutamate formiminotransferase / 5-formyltetrahydrofolate cyclo-ligase
VAGLIECVPNFSEGRRPDVLDGLRRAVTHTPGVTLLDWSADPDHNRSVLTFAGTPDAVTAAALAASAVAISRIDLGSHQGQHPRIGAIDVVPFVPLEGSTMDECVAVARAFGQRLAADHELPVYLYGEAATRPERRVLSDIRKPQFEGLEALIATSAYEPDFGPARRHPTAGATVVGARPFLIAYNINLESDDLALAKQIASTIRERNGGLARVQALGLFLDDLGCAQVSMNLLDFSVTPLWRAWEEVERLAADAGVSLRESELIGLAPVAALTAVADHCGVSEALPLEERLQGAAAWLRIRDFDPAMGLELRLAALRGESG